MGVPSGKGVRRAGAAVVPSVVCELVSTLPRRCHCTTAATLPFRRSLPWRRLRNGRKGAPRGCRQRDRSAPRPARTSPAAAAGPARADTGVLEGCVGRVCWKDTVSDAHEQPTRRAGHPAGGSTGKTDVHACDHTPHDRRPTHRPTCMMASVTVIVFPVPGGPNTTKGAGRNAPATMRRTARCCSSFSAGLTSASSSRSGSSSGEWSTVGAAA